MPRKNSKVVREGNVSEFDDMLCHQRTRRIRYNRDELGKDAADSWRNHAEALDAFDERGAALVVDSPGQDKDCEAICAFPSPFVAAARPRGASAARAAERGPGHTVSLHFGTWELLVVFQQAAPTPHSFRPGLSSRRL